MASLFPTSFWGSDAVKQVLLAAALASAPIAAHAQAPDVSAHAQTPQPITLSPQEYQQIIVELVRRDPVAALLLQKQSEAQAAAKDNAKTEPNPK